MATKNTSLAVKYRPQDWDDVCGQTVVKQILKHQVDTKTFKQGYLFAGHFGCGKALPVYEKIFTDRGYIRMEDARVGMKVWGEDGTLHNIVGVYPQGSKQCYRIHFSGGGFADCCIDHLWTVKSSKSKIKSGPHKMFTCSTRWLINELGTYKERPTRLPLETYCIPTCRPMEFDTYLPYIPPYLIGVLFSSGFVEGNSIYLEEFLEEDTKDRCEKCLYDIGLKLVHSRAFSGLRCYEIVEFQEGCWDAFVQFLDKIYDKKLRFADIPVEYLFCSLESRRELLRGIFDCNGYIDNSDIGLILDYGTYRRAASSIRFLIHSLGFVISDYHEEGASPSEVRISVRFDKDFIPFYSDRLKSLFGKGTSFKKNSLYRKIEYIEPIGNHICQCIMTDNPTGLFLTQDLIVTHNTTCARIFAKSINGGPHDIIELDAASYNSVDQIRQLSEEAKKKPLVGKYKIFIIDEAHSLSQSANNALLKILEEPPATAIFILATTDPQKMLNTVLSRVQRYDFTVIPSDEIIGRLNMIAEKENIQIDDASVRYIAKISGGGMRDAISYLDKCHSLYDTITLDKVVSVLSTASYHSHLDLLRSLVHKDAQNAISIVNSEYESGKDMKKFVSDFMYTVCDVCNKFIFNSYEYINIPELPEYSNKIDMLTLDQCLPVLEWSRNLNTLIRNDINPKNTTIVEVTLWCMK